jgi:hypothetical protein
MAKNIGRRFTKFLPGAGYDANGSPKQGKTRVVGVVNVTAYTRGGESLTPRDIGLTTVDSISLRVRDEVAGPGAELTRDVLYNNANELFYLVQVDSDGTRIERAANATETVEFDAFGDSAHDVELT